MKTIACGAYKEGMMIRVSKVLKLENFNGHISNFDYTPLTNLDFNASVSNRKEHHDDWQEGPIVGIAT